MESDLGRGHGRGRPTLENVKPDGRRPGEELSYSPQPRAKIARKSHSTSSEDSGASGSREKEKARERLDREAEPSTSREVACPTIKEELNQTERVAIGDARGRRERYEIIHTRPSSAQSKRGTGGTEINLHANYFKLLKKPNWRLYQYHVDFSPEVEMIRIRRGILSENKRVFGGYLFDGKMLFTTTKLAEDLITLETKSKSGDVYKISVKFVGTISMNEGQSLQVLNIILRRAMEGLQLQLVGRNFFDALAKIDIREYRIQLWPGYTTSIRQHENDILLCAEIAHKVMRTETVYDILQNSFHEYNTEYQEHFKRQVLGLTVLTDYNNRTYRIDDIDYTSNPKKTFSLKGVETSFIDYYYKKYHIRIRDPDQPLLMSQAKDRQIRGGEPQIVILIPELCRTTGLNDSMRSNFQLMRAMSQHTRLNPDRRIARLKTFNRRLTQTEASMKVLKDWQMTLDAELVEFRGRLLKNENIVFAEKKKVLSDENADWTKYLRNHEMFTRIQLDRWAVVCPSRSQREANGFVDTLIHAARGLGMGISHPQMSTIYDDRNHSYLNAIESCAVKDPQLIMCIVPNNNAERYSSIKKKTCVERCIPTQVMLHKTVTPKGGNPRSLMSVATKVAIQMNCKLGAAAWMIEMPLGGLMTIGYDTCRSTKDKSRSFGALIAASFTPKLDFFSMVAPCNTNDNLSNELSVSVTKALQEYLKSTKTLPNRIIFYRDGVGDGQIHQILKHEVNVLSERLKSIYKSAKMPSPPRFAFIIVSKQINTRLFARERNPPPGTIVDDVITLPERYDFYLVSQSVRQGTVSPTSYNVVYDTMGLDPSRMQILTYKMCHLYYNWSGTTRVPAVCQYAKKLATLVAQSIHQPPSSLLEKQLYFL